MDPNTVTIIGISLVLNMINLFLNFLILISIFTIMETKGRKYL